MTGGFAGACLLALLGAWITPKVSGGFEGPAALFGGWLGGFVGAILGFALGLWLVLRRNSPWGGPAVAGLTGTAIMVCVCLAYVAFSR